MLALSLNQAKTAAIVIVVVLAAIALLTAKFVAGVTKKAILLLLVGALALGVWTQRQSLQTCADRVRQTDGVRTATCSFFGSDITIEGPLSD